jgi:hypothetical protein
MRSITVAELRRLLDVHASPCISIYVPARDRRDAEPIRSRLGSLVDVAVSLLTGKVGAEALRELLEPLRSLDKRLDAALALFLRDRVAPLILAGTAASSSRYRAVNPRAELLEEDVQDVLLASGARGGRDQGVSAAMPAAAGGTMATGTRDAAASSRPRLGAKTRSSPVSERAPTTTRGARCSSVNASAELRVSPCSTVATAGRRSCSSSQRDNSARPAAAKSAAMRSSVERWRCDAASSRGSVAT